MRRALRLALWAAQPVAAIAIGAGLLLVEVGRRMLRAEVQTR